VVVDNASIDNTVELIQKNFPQTKIIKLEKNIGYGNGNNAALKHANTDFALILNPDAIIAEKDLEMILTIMKQNQNIALAAPLLLSSYPETAEEKAKQLKIVEGNLLQKFDDYLSVKYLIGAVLLLKMSVFKKIGFFDEEIFLYYEDDEISWRAIQNGYQAAIIPNAIAFHIGQGSSGSSLRNIYRRFWHRALSKLYWKKKSKSNFSAIKSALRLSIVFFTKSIFYAITFNPKKAVENFASGSGSLAFLIGLKAFDNNGNPRG
jgi:N-acetylglucosaminyl-diphospho-decaprenol L-rhamnosyltransferase